MPFKFLYSLIILNERRWRRFKEIFLLPKSACMNITAIPTTAEERGNLLRYRCYSNCHERSFTILVTRGGNRNICNRHCFDMVGARTWRHHSEGKNWIHSATFCAERSEMKVEVVINISQLFWFCSNSLWHGVKFVWLRVWQFQTLTYWNLRSLNAASCIFSIATSRVFHLIIAASRCVCIGIFSTRVNPTSTTSNSSSTWT